MVFASCSYEEYRKPRKEEASTGINIGISGILQGILFSL